MPSVLDGREELRSYLYRQVRRAVIALQYSVFSLKIAFINYDGITDIK